MAVSAYNLVRAVMCLAARRSRMDPRQLSFSQVLNVVNCAWPKLIAAATSQEHHREFARVLEFAAQCTLPRRSKRRSYPRLLWRRRPAFPYRKENTKGHWAKPPDPQTLPNRARLLIGPQVANLPHR